MGRNDHRLPSKTGKVTSSEYQSEAKTKKRKAIGEKGPIQSNEDMQAFRAWMV